MLGELSAAVSNDAAGTEGAALRGFPRLETTYGCPVGTSGLGLCLITKSFTGADAVLGDVCVHMFDLPVPRVCSGVGRLPFSPTEFGSCLVCNQLCVGEIVLQQGVLFVQCFTPHHCR